LFHSLTFTIFTFFFLSSSSSSKEETTILFNFYLSSFTFVESKQNIFVLGSEKCQKMLFSAAHVTFSDTVEASKYDDNEGKAKRRRNVEKDRKCVSFFFGGE